VRALEGGGRSRARPLGRGLALFAGLAVVAAGVAVAVGWPLSGVIGVSLPKGHSIASRPGAVAGTISSPQASATAEPRTSSQDTLAAAQAIVAPASAPARLRIPAIGVDAQVEALGLDAQGRMATPSRSDRVGWYRPGAAPGDVGNAVIDGHLDWTDGPAVFWRLGRLKRGDELSVLRADGSQARFLVQSSTTTPYDSSTDALFTRSGPPSLTLITCTGAWDRQRGTYVQRLVVRASLAAATPVSRPAAPSG
jgi:LPXTG-site transpeptidase (sortase) family protein